MKIQTNNNEEEIRFLSTAEFLEGGTADQVVDHIEKKFVQAQINSLNVIATESKHLSHKMIQS